MSSLKSSYTFAIKTQGGGKIPLIYFKVKRDIKIGMIKPIKKKQKLYLPLSELKDALNLKK